MDERKRRRSGAEWDEILTLHERSGQTAVAYCADHGLNVSQFYKRRRYRREQRRFVAVEMPPRVPQDSPIEVAIGEVTVRCTARTPPRWIGELASALR